MHPLEHADRHGGLVHLSGHAGHDEEGSGPNALCDAIAALAACMDGRLSLALPALAAADISAAAPATVPRGVPPPAYRSQAPPQHA